MLNRLSVLLRKSQLDTRNNIKKAKELDKTRALPLLRLALDSTLQCQYSSYSISQVCYENMIKLLKQMLLNDAELMERALLGLTASGLLNEETIDLLKEPKNLEKFAHEYNSTSDNLQERFQEIIRALLLEKNTKHDLGDPKPANIEYMEDSSIVRIDSIEPSSPPKTAQKESIIKLGFDSFLDLLRSKGDSIAQLEFLLKFLELYNVENISKAIR